MRGVIFLQQIKRSIKIKNIYDGIYEYMNI